jgi:RNA polymerase sigma-70 factor (ECF subfamily)
MEHSARVVMALQQKPEPLPTATGVEDVALARSGDVRAFERLYRVHCGRVHGLARRMMGGDDAAELTQDVFVRAWSKLGTFRGESAFGTWLYRLAINLILTRRAQRATRRGREVEDPETLDGLEGRPGGSDLAMDFDSAIERLPEGARQVFVLHDVEGYKHEEIGKLMGVNPGTSKAQLHRARMILRRHLGPRGE